MRRIKNFRICSSFFFFTLSLTVLTLTGYSVSQAELIKGLIVDQSNRPISHVTIVSPAVEQAVMSDSEGRFEISTASNSEIQLSFSHTGYIPKTIKSDLPTDELIIKLTGRVHQMDGITVTAGRAVAGQTPVSFQNIDREQIRRDYDIGEVPALLETSPNLYSYSDAGGGLGYSYISMRGFNARRTPVYINGVPLNDPEDHALYFVDMPDFASHADDIQIQRGVGNALYGDPVFGGSVNILTSPFSRGRSFEMVSGYGGFWHEGETVGLMRKNSVSYATGLMNNGWAISASYLTQYSDGYRENSWYDGSAYYLSLGRLDPNMLSIFNMYGGPMRTHASWDGIDRLTMQNNRRTNWYSYDDETDNFSQPHFEYHNIYNFSESVTLYNSLYLIKGKGYYEQLKMGDDLLDYNLSISSQSSDLIRRKWVNKNQIGFNSRTIINKERSEIGFGGSYYFFESEHWGEVIWAEALSPSNLTLGDPDRYYEYFGKYHNFSGFASVRRSMTDNLSLFANLQLRHLSKNIHQTPIGNFETTIYDLNWTFLSPRLGINYAFSERVSSYFSFSVASQDPIDDMIDDADNPADRPNLEIVDSTGAITVYGDPLVGAEQVYNFELGFNFNSEDAQFGANLFWMEYRNGLVPDGRLNDDGFPTYGNAERSVHRGIDLTAKKVVRPGLSFEANYAFNDNWIKKYDQLVDSATTIKNRDVATPNSPSYLANFVVDYSYDRYRVVYRLRAVGRQYVSLDGRYAKIGNSFEDVSIAPYATSSLKGIINLGSILGGAAMSLEGRVDNLFDHRYETFGYRWGDYFAYWPAAERNWYINLKLAI